MGQVVSKRSTCPPGRQAAHQPERDEGFYCCHRCGVAIDETNSLMNIDFDSQLQKLHESGNPFAIATVIRAEKPTSAKVGAKAIITESGSLTGWIGGSCAEPTVKREAKKALQDGQPR